ncbi:hypothetical protein CKM354_000085800 [Cercospora kikuchii]|uniref:Uncharacterized protein n=1 Tax=Cercospora kikuchii TaxID=84275 RepID=A0A9P3FBE0_9PEZI|nr:uncharacterized protein CKM354_000085800 [Cercospora kikuchii]GIZ37412.1 hypothetical protein CKM354_000085800 [Cercospora kikuchii]
MASRNYLITGAARGIGRGLTRLLLSKGHRVFLIDNNESELTHFTTQLSKQQGTAQKSQTFSSSLCDLRQPSQIKQAISLASDFFQGHLDVLINNAADTSSVTNATPLADQTLEDWTAALETNLTAPFLLVQSSLPLLTSSRATAANVINISSTRALMAEPNHEAYSTTKAGLLGLTQSLAVSLAPQNIRVNAILPGWINVAHECKKGDEEGVKWEDGLTEDDHKWHLTGRVGKVEDMWRAVEYLVENEGVSGTEIVVDGGVTRKMVYPEE